MGQAADQVSQFQSTASVYAMSNRQFNELADEDASMDFQEEINQEFNNEYNVMIENVDNDQ